MKKVSIVLPVYNGEKYVGKSIESVLSQTFENIELIIVNDCSTDNTGTVIRGYAQKDNRIRIIENETNQKLPKSLNIGFANATGDYFTWTSDDNQYRPDAIEKMLNALEDNPELSFVYADYTIVKLDGTLIREAKNDEPDCIRFYNVVGACFLYTRELAELAGEYNAEMFLAEDYEFWIRCYMHGKFMHIKEDLYYYGMHEKNLTSTRQKEIGHQTYYVMNYHYDFLISKCITQEDKNRYYWDTLGFISDKKEKKQVRKKYYDLDSSFKKMDIKRRCKEAMRLFPPIRIVVKIKRKLLGVL